MVTIDRRHLLRLLAAAGGVIPAYARAAVSEAASLSPGSGQAAAAAGGAIVRTVLKDVPPDALGPGAALFHEHLSVNFQRGKPGARCRTMTSI
jgi:hypothetical protein